MTQRQHPKANVLDNLPAHFPPNLEQKRLRQASTLYRASRGDHLGLWQQRRSDYIAYVQ